MKNVIFIAPPAAGKGTQSAKLEEMGYIHISTGDMLREEINAGSALGKNIEEIMQSGNLVSDEIVFTLIKNKMSHLDKPFILDGFPRTLEQAKMLDDLFKELNIGEYAVIYLDITMEEAMKRALGRLTCKCGETYNKYIDNLKPKVDGICDKCGSALTIRGDDNEESFKVRFQTFMVMTNPIKDFYQNKNKLYEVDATIDVTKITEKIKEIIK